MKRRRIILYWLSWFLALAGFVFLYFGLEAMHGVFFICLGLSIIGFVAAIEWEML